MDLDRQYIERSDFSAARRGYDPDEVDAHLREIADAVEELKRAGGRRVASAPRRAEQVRAIVEAAENSAGDIESHGPGRGRPGRPATPGPRPSGSAPRPTPRPSACGARRRGGSEARSEAERRGAQTREKAESEASAHVEKVAGGHPGGCSRAPTGSRRELDGLVENLRSTVELARRHRARPTPARCRASSSRSAPGWPRCASAAPEAAEPEATRRRPRRPPQDDGAPRPRTRQRPEVERRRLRGGGRGGRRRGGRRRGAG